MCDEQGASCQGPVDKELIELARESANTEGKQLEKLGNSALLAHGGQRRKLRNPNCEVARLRGARLREKGEKRELRLGLREQDFALNLGGRKTLIVRCKVSPYEADRNSYLATDLAKSGS